MFSHTHTHTHTQTKNHGNCEIMDTFTSLIVLIISQCIHIANDLVIHLQYITVKKERQVGKMHEILKSMHKNK